MVLVQDWGALDDPWTELTECVADLPVGALDLGIVGSDVYYGLDAATLGELAVRRCEPTAGGAVIGLQLPALAPRIGVYAAKFLVADGDVWVLLNGNTLRGPLGADALELVATTAANVLAVVDGDVFAASEDGTALVRIDDGVTTELLADEVVLQLAIQDDSLYWMSQLGPDDSPNYVVRSRLLAELGG